MYFFVTFSFFCLIFCFDMDSRNFDFNTLRNKANVKIKLTQKFGALVPYGSKSLLLVLKRTTKKFNFLLLPFQFFFQKNESALHNGDFVTHTVKELSKFGRIKENRAPLHRKLSYCHQKQPQQTETYLGFATR